MIVDFRQDFTDNLWFYTDNDDIRRLDSSCIVCLPVYAPPIRQFFQIRSQCWATVARYLSIHVYGVRFQSTILLVAL